MCPYYWLGKRKLVPYHGRLGDFTGFIYQFTEIILRILAKLTHRVAVAVNIVSAITIENTERAPYYYKIPQQC